MTIAWHGKTCVSIEGDEGVLMANPDKEAHPKKPPDLILFSAPGSGYRGDGKETVIIDSPGEWDLKGFFVFSFSGIYLIDTEGRSIVYLPRYDKEALSEEDLEKIEGVDVLILSVGAIEAEKAAKLVNQLEPHVVIPIDYTGKAPTEFLKEIGASGLEPQPKFVVKPKTVFAEEKTEVVLLKQ